MYKDGFPENEVGRYVLGSKAMRMTERGQRDDSMLLAFACGHQSFSHRTGHCVADLEIRREEPGRGGSFPS